MTARLTTVDEALQFALHRLQGVSGSPRQDAYALIGVALGNVSREYLIAHHEHPVSPEQALLLEQLLTLRAKGMPLPYLQGRRAFFDRTLFINPHVLIPRPETEHVVELALAWAADHSIKRAIDIGTGSGAIAVTLAAQLPAATVYAADISGSALEVAKLNGAGSPNLRYVQSDLLAAFAGQFDLICANLPYIATEHLDVLEVAKFEPSVALDGGHDGLSLIRRFLTQIEARINRPGLLLLEHGADQGQAVAALAQAALPHTHVSVVKDLARLDRVVRVEFCGE